MRKKIFVVVIATIILCGFPLLINWLILKPSVFETVGDGSTWLLFWATYLSAIASFSMVLITWLTLKESRRQNKELLSQNEELIQQNNQQLDELKRQWEELHRPFLLFSVISHDGFYFLKIENAGKELAKKITIKFSEEFLNGLLFKESANRLRTLQTPFCIEAQTSKYYTLAPCRGAGSTFSMGNESFSSEQVNEWLDRHISDPIVIECYYSDKYSINETISIQMFSTPSAVLNDAATDYLGWIKRGLVFQNTYHRPIQESLERLANEMHSLNVKQSLSRDASQE